MSSDIAIKVENLSKCYNIYDTPRDRLKQFVAPPLQRFTGQTPKQYFREFWALKDVSFEVGKGETVGIIGRNGSGKSTLLQMICGTLYPTSGSIQTHGRTAALLELGSGFNPEFTGRENVYMNAAVLGLSNEEISARFDDIAAFADIGNFIEQPVKTYSSGMIVRLAFSVAINVDPEIFVVDEALSVGDELFQRKCFSRIEAIKSNGATILFVSHSPGMIIELCDRAMLIDAGERIAEGIPKQIVGRYQKLLYAPADKHDVIREQIRLCYKEELETFAEEINSMSSQYHISNKNENTTKESFDPNLKPGSTIEYESLGARIVSPSILTLAGDRVNNLRRCSTYRYTYTVQFTKSASNIRFGMLIKTITGVELAGSASSLPLQGLNFVPQGSKVIVSFIFDCNLNPGIYYLNAGVAENIEGVEITLHRLLDAEVFRVMHEPNSISLGFVDLNCRPNVELKLE